MSLDYLNKNSHGIVFGNSCYYFFLEGGHRGNVGVGVGVGVGDCDGVSDHETRRVQRAPVVASSRSDVVCYAVCTWYAHGIIFSLSQTNIIIPSKDNIKVTFSPDDKINIDISFG